MKTLLLTFMILIGQKAQAITYCHTPTLNKIFKIEDNHIVFLNSLDRSVARTIAEAQSRNKNDRNGINKVLDYDNQKHIIHIDNEDHFSDLNDYIIIRNKEGHEITYPLTCSH